MLNRALQRSLQRFRRSQRATSSVSRVTGSTLRVEMRAVGGGANGVSDGDTTRRLKVAGFQIVEMPSSGTVTNLSLDASIPSLLGGNPATFPLMVRGVR